MWSCYAGGPGGSLWICDASTAAEIHEKHENQLNNAPSALWARSKTFCRGERSHEGVFLYLR